MKNLEDDISEIRKKEIEYNTRHMLTKKDLSMGLADLNSGIIKYAVVLFIMLGLMIIGLYFK